MSLSALVWAFDQHITPSSVKFVLVCLADCANPYDGKIFPSIDSLVEKTCQDRKTIIAAIDTLEGMGFLIDTGEKRGQSKQIKVYKLNGYETDSDRISHYVYRLTSPVGEFYIGVRSSVYKPEMDISYMGSGVWPNTMRRKAIPMTKEIIRSFNNRAEAEVFEKEEIIRASLNPKCKNINHNNNLQRVPNFPSDSTVFPDRESQISHQTVPKTVHGTSSLTQDEPQVGISCSLFDLPNSKSETKTPPMFKRFMETYPKQRRDSLAKTLPAYRKAITKTTEETIYAACVEYARSDEVARGYAKGTIAWLNAERWTVAYGIHPAQVGASNGKRTYGDSIADAAEIARLVLDEKENIRAQAN